jgi:hypothetical protein
MPLKHLRPNIARGDPMRTKDKEIAILNKNIGVLVQVAEGQDKKIRQEANRTNMLYLLMTIQLVALIILL